MGNEVDFFGDRLRSTSPTSDSTSSTLTENIGQGARQPCRTSRSRSTRTLTAAPDDNYSTSSSSRTTPSARGWSVYIDATTTGLWFGTGSQFAADAIVTPCTWAELLTTSTTTTTCRRRSCTRSGSPRASTQAWHGAVDGLRVGDTIYDFEEFGVVLAEPLVDVPDVSDVSARLPSPCWRRQPGQVV